MNIGPHPVERTGDPAGMILAKVAVLSGITVGDLVSHRRAARSVRPRQLAYYLFAQLTGWSNARIAKQFTRDMTTVSHGQQAFKERMAREPAVAAQAQRIEAELIQQATRQLAGEAVRTELAPVIDRGTGIAASEFRRVADLAFEVDPVAAYRRIYDALLPLARRRIAK